ncbi:MAG: 4-(cytidine 5'-diphospho)-2-C-methyl-D-erythritol kinase [Bacteroidota bacterium]|nr:4-(cytidine 5'-diphospho)-2-C-methyl-D-erythritol kinase [Bacteroidota bacterium]
MIIFPGSKINIGLEIINKRDDGFHDLETVFYPLPWSDIIEGVVAEHDTVTFSGLHIDGDIDDNLIVRAVNILRNDYDFEKVHLHLHKVVPMGAGLGGGSADAAATLLLLNSLFQLALSSDVMEEYARKLGSDCAFFIRNKPVFACGKGDVFTDVSLNLSGWKILVIKPKVHVGTEEAYAGVVPKKSGNSLVESVNKPVNQWNDLVKNDFEQSVFKKYPEIESIKKYLKETGADYTAMSGSGASVYGLFSSEKEIQQPEMDNIISWWGEL